MKNPFKSFAIVLALGSFLAPGARAVLYDEEIPTRNDSRAYALDISGSMNWDSRSYKELGGQTTSGSRLERAKVELIRSIGDMSTMTYPNMGRARICDLKTPGMRAFAFWICYGEFLREVASTSGGRYYEVP